MSFTAGVRSSHELITAHSPQSLMVELTLSFLSGAGASATWPSSNRALFVPFYLAETIVATKMFVANGSAVSGNLDLGIYDEAGTRMVSSGSTAQAGTSAVQVVDITDTTLTRGTYYMALAFDNTTATTLRFTPSVSQSKAMGLAQQSSAFALPATATLAALASSYVPSFGVSFRSVTGAP